MIRVHPNDTLSTRKTNKVRKQAVLASRAAFFLLFRTHTWEKEWRHVARRTSAAGPQAIKWHAPVWVELVVACRDGGHREVEEEPFGVGEGNGNGGSLRTHCGSALWQRNGISLNHVSNILRCLYGGTHPVSETTPQHRRSVCQRRTSLGPRRRADLFIRCDLREESGVSEK